MGVHDSYGKMLLKRVAGDAFVTSGSAVTVPYSGVSAKIDGAIGISCAIEIESRTDKQIRGAILDLLCHPASKKLLIIIPANMHNPDSTIKHCEGILTSMKKPNDIARVVLLNGTGNMPDEEGDAEIIRNVLLEMGCL